MTLAELTTGATAIISEIPDDELGEKLLEIGCLPSEEVIMLGKAPLGGPIMVETKTVRLALRVAEAECIHVVLKGTNR